MNTIKIDLQYNLNQYQEEGEEPFYVLDALVYIDGERVYKGFVEPYAFFKDVASKGVVVIVLQRMYDYLLEQENTTHEHLAKLATWRNDNAH